MAERKSTATVYDDDDDSMPDVVPALSKAETDAWVFFQEPECSEVIELFNQSRFLASPSAHILRLLDNVQPHIIYSVYKATVSRYPNIKVTERYPDIAASVQRPLFEAISPLARLDSTFLIPRTASLFDFAFSDDETAEAPPPKKKAKGKRQSSPAPSGSGNSRYLLRVSAPNDEDTTPAKAAPKPTTIKAERVAPKAKRVRKSAPDPPVEPPRQPKKLLPPPPPPEDDDREDSPGETSIFPDFAKDNAHFAPTNRTGDPAPPAAVELVSSTVVHDGILPAKGHRSIYICTACSTRVTICVFRGWHTACYACRHSRTKCSFAKGPLQLLQSLERLRPLQTAGATGPGNNLYAHHFLKKYLLFPVSGNSIFPGSGNVKEINAQTF
ncbi:hypothetical protein B0H13DRAFT_1893044 [Mycena leptocephala]|nr:hypothetical protein B0H13DRAFT_1893044 [Mycena leptocephala]